MFALSSLTTLFHDKSGMPTSSLMTSFHTSSLRLQPMATIHLARILHRPELVTGLRYPLTIHQIFLTMALRTGLWHTCQALVCRNMQCRAIKVTQTPRTTPTIRCLKPGLTSTGCGCSPLISIVSSHHSPAPSNLPFHHHTHHVATRISGQECTSTALSRAPLPGTGGRDEVLLSNENQYYAGSVGRVASDVRRKVHRGDGVNEDLNLHI